MPCEKGKTKHVPRQHTCENDVFCECRLTQAFSCRPTPALEDIECNNGEPAILVETYLGGPPPPSTSGTTGVLTSAANLELCDTFQFWSEGTVFINATEGSVRLQFEAENLLTGLGDPNIANLVPKAPNRVFGYTDTSQGNFWMWDGITGSWIQISGGTTGTKPGGTG